MRKGVLALAVFNVAIAMPTMAKTIIVFGSGSYTCEQFTQDIRHHDSLRLLYEAWINGYVTAREYHTTPDRIDAVKQQINGDQMVMWIKEWCEDNPDGWVKNAVDAFLIDLANRGLPFLTGNLYERGTPVVRSTITRESLKPPDGKEKQ